jgi:hypothetical protein
MLNVNNLSAFGTNEDIPSLKVKTVLSEVGPVLSAGVRNYSWSNLDIGDPHPRRRIYLSFVTDYFPTSTMDISFTLTVDGVDYVMSPFGNQSAPNGTVFTNDFFVYTTRRSTYVSPVIPSGRTASLLCSNGARSNGYGIVIKSFINLQKINSAVTSSTITSGSLITVPKFSYANIIQSGLTSHSTISASGFEVGYRRINSSLNYDVLYYDYWNNTDSDYITTATSSDGNSFTLFITR